MIRLALLAGRSMVHAERFEASRSGGAVNRPPLPGECKRPTKSELMINLKTATVVSPDVPAAPR